MSSENIQTAIFESQKEPHEEEKVLEILIDDRRDI